METPEVGLPFSGQCPHKPVDVAEMSGRCGPVSKGSSKGSGLLPVNGIGQVQSFSKAAVGVLFPIRK